MDLLAAVSEERLMEHIAHFSKWIKHAGTAEELESLRYCQAQLEEFGFKTELLSHDAYISLPEHGSVTVDGEEFNGIAHSFSKSSAADGLLGELVYIGAGSDEDFAQADASGKIVLIDGVARPEFAVRARRHGAIGQVHISPHKKYLHEMCVSPVWGSPTHLTRQQLPSTVIVTVDYDAGRRIQSKLADNPGLETRMTAAVDTSWRQTPILVADMSRVEGQDSEPFVFFTGHHDTWYYGVMDNGGANATMLEVARVCAEARRQWKRSLRIVFWSGHSQGRYSSSSWYADQYWEELEERALVHVNVDSTGGKGNTDVSHTSSSAELRHLAEAALRVVAGQKFNGGRLGRAGDQAFWGIGVPGIFQNLSRQPALEAGSEIVGGSEAVLVGPKTGWWWHTPYDTEEAIDSEILLRDTRIYAYAVGELLLSTVLPVDVSAQARSIKEALVELQALLGGRFSLRREIERATKLESGCAVMMERVSKDAPEEVVEAANACIRDLSRLLVPIDYTSGNRFDHDPALPQRTIPALSVVAELVRYAEDSDEARFRMVELMRKRNVVGVALRNAVERVEAFSRLYAAR